MELVQGLEAISQSLVWASIAIPFVGCALLGLMYAVAK